MKQLSVLSAGVDLSPSKMYLMCYLSCHTVDKVVNFTVPFLSLMFNLLSRLDIKKQRVFDQSPLMTLQPRFMTVEIFGTTDFQAFYSPNLTFAYTICLLNFVKKKDC